MISRRQGFKAFAQLLLSSPLLAGQKQTAETTEVGPGGEEQLYDLINVFDFAKLDPVAWDYMAEGSQDEISLRDNRKAFVESHQHAPHILEDCGRCHNAHGSTSASHLLLPREQACRLCHN